MDDGHNFILYHRREPGGQGNTTGRRNQMKEQKKGGGGTRKHGRDKGRCAQYRSQQRGEKHKVKRVLESNGLEAAKKYAVKHNILGFFSKLTSE